MLARNTPIILYSGEIVPVESVQEGDRLMGPDNEPRTILKTFQGLARLYSVEPTKGDGFICADEHVLGLTGTNRFNGQFSNLSVLDYLRTIEEKPSSRMDWKIYRSGYERQVARGLLFHPWLIGSWLGDGTVGQAQWTFPDEELSTELRKQARDLELDVKVRSVMDRCPSYNLTGDGKRNPLRQFLRNDCYDSVLMEKRIPKSYLFSHRLNRLEMLAGLLDTDGHLAGGFYEIITRYAGLREDILYLARSLGYAAYTSVKFVKLQGWSEARAYQRVTISGDMQEIPCRVERKKAGKREQIKRTNVTGFVLREMQDGEYFGLSLDGDGRFLLGDFTVTCS